MSSGNQTAGPSRSTDGSTAIFEAAKKEYKKFTRKDIDTHRFAAQLDNCKSPEAFSNVLQEQADAFNTFRERDEKLMNWLRPIVQILFTISGTIAQGVGIVSHLIRPARSFSNLWLPDIPTREHGRHRYLCSSPGTSVT